MTKPTIISDKDGQLEVEGFPVESDAERAERKKFSARCGHVKRRVLRNERLTGPLLEFALDIVPDEFGKKLKADEALSDYDRHLVVDVFLLHAALATRAQLRKRFFERL